MRTDPTAPDEHGNRFAEEGVDRCACGSKYWNDDRCIDCGTPVTMRTRSPFDLSDGRGSTLRATMYGGAHFGTPARPNANPVLSLMRDDDISHDPWGTAMAWCFAVCDYLHHVALHEVPAELDYRPSATERGEGFDDESYPDRAVAEAGLDTYTLTMAARILSRYLDWCKAAGRDY